MPVPQRRASEMYVTVVLCDRLGSHLIYFIVAFVLIFVWIVRMVIRWRLKKRAAHLATVQGTV